MTLAAFFRYSAKGGNKMFGLNKLAGLNKLTGSQVSETVSTGLTTAGNGAKNGATAVYNSVMGHPKTTAAVVLGTGAAAAIWWVLRNPQRVAALRRQIASRTEALRLSRRESESPRVSA
jgi:hypothetical protein